MRTIFILFFFSILLISSASAFDFDNRQSYNVQNDELTYKNSFGLGAEIAKVKLLSSHNVEVFRGKDRKVAELEIEVFKDYKNGLKDMKFIDMNSGQEIQRDIKYKIKMGNSWQVIENGDLKKGQYTIGIFTDVQENDYVDWKPIFFGNQVFEGWATWSDSFNTDLRAYWKMNETTGSKIDSTGKYNWTLSGGTLYNAQGLINATSIGDNTNRGTTGGVLANATKLTLAFWVNRSSFASGERFFGSNSQNFDMQAQDCSQTGDGWCPVFNNIGGTNTQTLSDSNWHLLVGVFNSGDRAEYYVDNILRANNSAGTFSDINDNLFLMAYDGTDTSASTIKIDEVGVWNRTLTGSELTDLYNNGAGISFIPTAPAVACENITVAGTYQITGNITSGGACIYVKAHNVVIDGKGNYINYATARAGSGISISSFDNVTIKNVNIYQNGTNANALSNAYGIYMTTVRGALITNNTIKTRGAGSNYGIFMDTSDTGGMISNNTIITTGSSNANFGIYMVTGASNNIIYGNNVSTNGTDNNIAIYLSTTSTHNIVKYNIVKSNGTSTLNQGIYLNGAVNNTLHDNNVTSGGTGSDYAIYLTTSSLNNSILNNTITTGTSGASNHGIFLTATSNNNLVKYNNILTKGANDNYGIVASSTANGNTIRDNNITTGTTSANNIGVYLTSTTHNNSIINNSIFTKGTDHSYGITLFSTAHNNSIINNTVFASGSSNANFGIYINTDVRGNSIRGNNVTANGTDSNLGIYLQTNANNNTVEYNIVQTKGTTTDNYGIDLNAQANNNTINNNNVTTAGSSVNYGLYLNTNAFHNSFSNNTIIASGTALYIVASSNNTFMGNSLNNTSGSAIRLETASVLNITLINTNITSRNPTLVELVIANSALNDINIIDSPIRNFSITNSTMLFRNSTYGEIKFLQGITGTGGNLFGNATSLIIFKNNSVSLDTNNILGFNRTTNVSLYNIGTYANPAVFKNDALCPASQCYNFTSLNAGNVNFNVTSWTNYSIGSGVNPFDVSTCRVLSISGTYNQSATITANANNCISFNASNIIFNGGGNSISNATYSSNIFFASNVTNITILRINPTNIGSGSIGVYFSNVTNSTINNSEITINLNTGIKILNSNGNNINNVLITSGINGVDVDNSSYNTLLNVTANSNINAGISLDTASNNNILTKIATNSNGNGIDIQISNNTVLNDIDSNGNNNGIYMATSANSSVSNARIASSLTSGISIFTSKNLTFSFINSTSNTNNGLGLLTSTYNSISNLNATGNGLYGLYLSSSSSTTIFNYMASGNTKSVSDTGNSNNYLIFNSTQGQIKFIGNSNNASITGSIDGNIAILNNNAYVNSGTLTELASASANVTLLNVAGIANPTILKDGVACGNACYNFTSLQAGTVIFNVSSWSNYSIGGVAGVVSQWHFENNDTIGLSDVYGFNNLTLNGSVIQNFSCIQGNCTKNLNDLGINKLMMNTPNLFSNSSIPFSLGYWFRIDNMNASAIIGSRGLGANNNWLIDYNGNGRINGETRNSLGVNSIITNDTYFLTDGWHLLTMTSNASSQIATQGDLNIFIDGNKKITLAPTPSADSVANTDVFGGWSNSGTYKNNISLDEGFYYSKVLNDTEIGALYNLYEDPLNRTVNILYPLNNSNVVTSNNQVNVTFNISVSNNGAYSKCWYSNMTLNISLPCGNNVTYPAIIGSHHLIYYLNNLGNVTYNETVFSVVNSNANMTYQSPVVEGEANDVYLNITATSISSLTGNLNYNGVIYPMNVSSNGTYATLGATAIAPIVSALSYINLSVSYVLNGFPISTSNFTQQVTDLGSLTISSSCSPASIAFNLSDEQNFTSLIGDFQYVIKYGLSNNTLIVSNGSITGSNTLRICANLSIMGNFTIGDGEIFYQSSGYEDRRYYLFSGTPLTNVTNVINIYDLISSAQTSFKLEIEDTSLNPYVDKLTALLRWYPQLNEYRIVDMGKTDITGSTVIHVRTEDVDYRVAVYEKNGTLINLDDPTRMICLVNPCTYTMKISPRDDDFTSFLNVQYTLNFNETTGYWTFVYSDPSQRTQFMNLTIYKDTTLTSFPICSSTSSGYVGAISCNTSAYLNGVQRAVVTRQASPKVPIAEKVYQFTTTVFTSTLGLWLSILVGIPLIMFMAFVTPIGAIVGGVIALIPALYFQTINIGIFGGIAVLAGIVAHFLKRIS